MYSLKRIFEKHCSQWQGQEGSELVDQKIMNKMNTSTVLPQKVYQKLEL